MIAKADLTPDQFNITSEKMWLFCLYMFTIGSETFDNGTQSAKKAKYKGSDETLAMTASRMIKIDKVIKAKTAIMAETEADVPYTIKQYQADIDKAVQFAYDNRQPSAVISGITIKGRSMGFDKDVQQTADTLEPLTHSPELLEKLNKLLRDEELKAKPNIKIA